MTKWKSKNQRTGAFVLGSTVHIKGLMLLSLKLIAKFAVALIPKHYIST